MTATLDDQVRLMESNWFMSYPHDVYARLRREAPVYWSPRDELWAISKYEDVRWISKHPELFSNRYHIYVAGAKVEDNGQDDPRRHRACRATQSSDGSRASVRCTSTTS